MYHSITFNDEKNTWEDWHLVPVTKPVFAVPSVKTQYIDVPGRDGSIDYTENKEGGDVNYGMRQGSFEFYFLPDYDEWHIVLENLRGYLHGKRFSKVVLEDDPGYYYTGRFAINNWDTSDQFTTVTIEYTADPFKYELNPSDENYLWDPFDFEHDVVRNYADISVDDITFVKISRPGAKVRPIFTISSTDGNGYLLMKYGNKFYKVSDGHYKFLEIFLDAKHDHLVFIGKGTVSISYTGGSL